MNPLRFMTAEGVRRWIPGRSEAEGRDEVPQKGIHSHPEPCKRPTGFPPPCEEGLSRLMTLPYADSLPVANALEWNLSHPVGAFVWP